MTANEAQFRIARKRSVDQRFTFPNGLTDNVDEGLDIATTATDVTMPDRGGFYTLAQLDAPGFKTGDARSAELFDFDGNDGRTDVAIWNGTSGDWTIINSVTSATRVQADWGKDALGDKLVPGDYDGDGRADIAVWRPSEANWYIRNSSDGSTTVRNWGVSSGGDIPVPGDYDRDGRTDFAIFRQSDNNFYILRSSDGNTLSNLFSGSGDVPAASAPNQP
jgi:hypothetical protein